jgi:hypothetical protein
MTNINKLYIRLKTSLWHLLYLLCLAVILPASVYSVPTVNGLFYGDGDES